ncbi:PH domain-containing protein [Ectobacillus polymachus]|uniref:PH domain-containing protein n=1 Tax=Ectobacillus polymachus TaxID=1508806 RepID=UPI003A86A5D5
MKQLDKNMIQVWRVHAILSFVLYLIAIIVYAYVNERWWHAGSWVYAAGIIIIILLTYCEYVVFPAIRYRNFFYEVREDEIAVTHGLFIVTHIIIPMNRVQNVKTKQGPIMKHFHLSSLFVSTASNTEEIHGLLDQEAISLQKTIIKLAKVDEQDDE